MLLTGQPMHAFDLDRIAGAPARRAPRRATASRSSRSTTRRARSTRDVCLIADADGPTSIAGVMGGNRSEVQADTTRVLMEAANWNAAEHPRDVAEARPAQRGQRALREGPRARAGARGAGRRHAAHARADRRAARAGHDRRRRARAPSRRSSSGCATKRRRRPARRRRSRARRARCTSQRLGFETAERADGLDVTVPHWSGATTSRARPTSSRRSRGCTASTTSCPRRCRAAAARSAC